MNAPLFELRDLSACYGAFEALRVDELVVERGMRYGVIGGNGSGKTTLLHTLAGLHPPAPGGGRHSIRFENEDLYGGAARLNAGRRKITCVFQKPVLFRGTVFANVAYPLVVRGEKKSSVRKKVESALDKLGLSGFESRPSRSLSGGEQQRAAVARAIVFEPDVLLVDEPTSSIDLAYQHVIMSLLSDFSKVLGKTVIFSTHDLELAGEYSDRKIILERGRVVSDYPENLFMAKVVSEGGKTFARLPGGFTVPLPEGPKRPPGRARPETLRIRIDPASIRITRNPDGGGRILKIGTQKELVRVTVDVGAPLVIFLDAEEYGSLNLLAGERIDVTIPPDAVLVRGGGEEGKRGRGEEEIKDEL